MIQINLQWLAIPCWMASAWWVAHGLLAVIALSRMSDMGPMLAVSVGIRNGSLALCSGVLGWLIWQAFRSTGGH